MSNDFHVQVLAQKLKKPQYYCKFIHSKFFSKQRQINHKMHKQPLLSFNFICSMLISALSLTLNTHTHKNNKENPRVTNKPTERERETGSEKPKEKYVFLMWLRAIYWNVHFSVSIYPVQNHCLPIPSKKKIEVKTKESCLRFVYFMCVCGALFSLFISFGFRVNLIECVLLCR